jgi:hypothetical protein
VVGACHLEPELERCDGPLVARIRRVQESPDLAQRPPPRERARWPWLAAAALVVAAGVALRLAAASGDLWLDEIWSLELARLAGSVGGVFSVVHHDNNHHLNTLYLMVLGPDAPAVALRLLAVVGSGVMLAVAAASEGRRSRVSGLAWTTLLAGSYLLVHYGSEARGYSLALLFAVACFASMEGLVRTGRLRWAVLFAAAAVMGLLSHLTFLYALLAFMTWGAVLAARRRPGMPRPAALFLAFSVPAAAFVFLWLVDLRFLSIGGGPAYRLLDVLRELFGATLGLSSGGAQWIAVPVFLVAALEVARMARDGEAEWTFFVTVLVVGPAAVLLLTRPPYLAPRYFLVAVPFLLLLVARALARFARRGRWPALVALGLGVAFLAGNASPIAHLLRYGRGTYREALEFIVRESSEPVITVGSDNDFRNPVVLDYHRRHLAGGERFRNVPIDQWTYRSPQWALAHRFQGDPPADAYFVAPTGRRYFLVRVFPYAGLSGWDWYVYRAESIGDAR